VPSVIIRCRCSTQVVTFQLCGGMADHRGRWHAGPRTGTVTWREATKRHPGGRRHRVTCRGGDVSDTRAALIVQRVVDQGRTVRRWPELHRFLHVVHLLHLLRVHPRHHWVREHVREHMRGHVRMGYVGHVRRHVMVIRGHVWPRVGLHQGRCCHRD
jgi:hypothetical protein